jgi:hypothetical protein
MPLIAEFLQQCLEVGDFIRMVGGEVVPLADIVLEIIEFHWLVVVQWLVMFFVPGGRRGAT